jgi:hypothetical protein
MERVPSKKLTIEVIKSPVYMSEGMNEIVITRRKSVMKNQWPIEICLKFPPSCESHLGKNPNIMATKIPLHGYMHQTSLHSR